MKGVEVQDILNIIYNDIGYQTTKLCGDYEKDKAIQWRIKGMQHLIEEINRLRNLNQRSPGE